MNTVERVTVYGHTSSLSDSVRLRHGSVAGGSAGGRIGGGTSAVRARAAAHVHLFSHIYNINEANYYMIGGGTRPRMARASRGRPARGLRPYLSYRWSSNSKRHFRHRTLDCGHTQTRPHGLTASRLRGRSSKCTRGKPPARPVEMQTRDLLPLDPLAEVHANCSRVAIDAGEISAVLANTLLENINDLANAAAAQHQMPL